MRFPAAALGFEEESDLREKLKYIKEGHCERIHYIEDGYVYEEVAEAVGMFDYYSVAGWTDLNKILIRDKSKENILNDKFELQEPTSEDYKNTFYLGGIAYVVRNEPGWTEFWANDIPGSIVREKYNSLIVKVWTPITFEDIYFTDNITTWDKLRPFYQVFKDYHLPNKMFILTCHC